MLASKETEDGTEFWREEHGSGRMTKVLTLPRSSQEGDPAAGTSAGIGVALDDFGAGLASLGYLKKAPFDKIKIDKGFIRDVTIPGSRNPAIITAIVSLAQALDMVTTAEGIESRELATTLAALGCSSGQGYFFARPLASDRWRSALARSPAAATCSRHSACRASSASRSSPALRYSTSTNARRPDVSSWAE